MTAPVCPWCSLPFTPRRTGGKPQRFCRDACRRAYERELRAWARNQITAGGVPPANNLLAIGRSWETKPCYGFLGFGCIGRG